MKFKVEPPICPVDRPVEVRVTAVLDRPLETGERIAFAPPESWSSQPYCITFTKEPQVADPDRADYVSIAARGACFDLSIEPIMLPAGQPKGHVRKVGGTVREGRVPAGGEVVFWMHGYRATWLAEEATFRVWLGEDEIVAGAPRIRTTPGGADIPEDVLDFPLYLPLSDSVLDFGAAAEDGSDIRISKDDGTPLPYEI